MQLTRKILVSGISDIVITVVGFLGTLYFARELGPAPLGTYALVLTVVNWFVLVDFGVNKATTQRISAGTDPDQHFVAMAVIYTVQVILGVAVILIFRAEINGYIGGSFVALLIVIFVFKRLYQLFVAGIKGRRQVHVVDSVDAIERIIRVALQVALVFVGYRTLSLVVGHAVGVVAAAAIIFLYFLIRIDIRLFRPSWDHFQSLRRYVQYAWLSAFRSQSFSWVDVTVLGFFVASAAIGIYQIAWSLAMTFQLLATAIGRNLFPEISNQFGTGNIDRVEGLVAESLVYAGIIPIPGILGAALLGEQMLGIYGKEFQQGATILVVLAGVALFRAYDKTLVSAINGIDRPDISFKVNVLFIGLNVVLNVLFIWRIGVLGAAIATLVSLAVDVAIKWWSLSALVPLRFPVGEVGKQILSAAIMGVTVVGGIRWLSPITFIELLVLVSAGAGLYFAVLLAVSATVRSKFRSVMESANV